LNGAVISTINNFGVLAGIKTSLIAQLETALVDLQAATVLLLVASCRAS